MIGFIQGKVISSDGIKVVILTESGIGYEINYGYYASVDSDLGIHIHHHISENDQSLWGFNSLEDKKMFELLKTVNKVGSSKAYPLISQVGTETVIDAIMMEQTSVLTSAKGIGKKMAEQIVLSLKDKVKEFGTTHNKMQPILDIQVEKQDAPKIKSSIDKKLLDETILALDSLGYKEKDMISLIKSSYNESMQTSEELLKVVLREL
ncbi:MAG: helix-hairpin-helix domain-containing protein [Bacteriovoracaceae bacterium]|jgi:Holliday junction DNA helicase RuvA|nr:helix-hairpin-helix domain-containing protein [Bacteriovoracaceae bacterium]